MHILFLTDNFPPEVNAPASRTFEHCREWVKAGHQVTVVTCVPNFPKGKIYDGYSNRILQSEVMDGIRVIRVWSYIAANEGFLRRIFDYVSYMVSAVLASPYVGKVDLVIGTSPQFFTACAAYMVSRYKRVPFVFELRDLWPESIKAVGAMRDGAVLNLLEQIELRLYRAAARIVCVTQSFKETLTERGIDPNKIDVVTNGVDLVRFVPQPKNPELEVKLGLTKKFVVGYVGTHGLAHGLSTLLDAAALMGQERTDDRFRLLLLGDGAMKASLVKEAKQRKLENVIFLDSVSKEEVGHYWSLLDASVIHLRKSPLFKTVIPSKLFESVAMSIPVLHGVEGESAEIVRSAEIGLTFEPENPAALCQCLFRLSEEASLMSKFRANCRAAAESYDRRVLAGKMLHALEFTVNGTRAHEGH